VKLKRFIQLLLENLDSHGNVDVEVYDCDGTLTPAAGVYFEDTLIVAAADTLEILESGR